MFIEILFKILLFKGGVLIYAEHCIYMCVCVCVCVCVCIYIQLKSKVYLNRISKMLIILPRRIIQNACYCLFSTDLNNIFHIKDVYM